MLFPREPLPWAVRVASDWLPLMNAVEEARDWAATATPFERKAWLLACFDAISPKDQAGFLAYVSRRASA